MDHLVENYDVVRRLEELNIVIAGTRRHWRAGVESCVAAFLQRPV
jgi:hypothetical protein